MYVVCIPLPVVSISVPMVEKHGSWAETEPASASHCSIFPELNPILSKKRQGYMERAVRTNFLLFLI